MSPNLSAVCTWDTMVHPGALSISARCLMNSSTDIGLVLDVEFLYSVIFLL